MSESKSDALSTIGTILSEPMGRDAIHVAVLSAAAGHPIRSVGSSGAVRPGRATDVRRGTERAGWGWEGL